MHSSKTKSAPERDADTLQDTTDDDYLVYEFDGWSFSRLAAERKSRFHFLLGEPYRYVTVILLPAKDEKVAKEVDPRHHLEEEEVVVRKPQGKQRHGSAVASSSGSSVYRGRRLICLDSPCYHAGGPLGEGDIVELEDLAGKHASSLSSSRQRDRKSYLSKEEGVDHNENAFSFLCIRCPWHRWLVSLETGEEVLLYPGDTPLPKDIEEENENKRLGVPSASSSSKPFATHVLKEVDKENGGSLSTSHATPPNNFTSGQKAKVVIGKQVQRLHFVEIDEKTGILRIKVDKNAGVVDDDKKKRCSQQGYQKSFVKSDALAMSLKNGARCMEIQDIKSRGLDLL